MEFEKNDYVGVSSVVTVEGEGKGKKKGGGGNSKSMLRIEPGILAQPANTLLLLPYTSLTADSNLTRLLCQLKPITFAHYVHLHTHTLEEIFDLHECKCEVIQLIHFKHCMV